MQHSTLSAVFQAIRKKLSEIYQSWGALIGLAGVALIPLKLSFAYILIAAYTLTWCFGGEVLASIRRARPLLAPLLLFLIVALCGSVFGLDARHSVPKLVGFMAVAFLIPVFFSICERTSAMRVIFALLCGQAIAATHSLLEGAFPLFIPSLFLGKVTESGQLALSVVMAVGYIIYLYRDKSCSASLANHFCVRTHIKDVAICLGATLFLVIAAFSATFGWDVVVRLVLAVASLVLIIFLGKLAQNKSLSMGENARNMLHILLPLLVCALLVNLKRGPWTGVLVGASILVILYGKRYMFPSLLGLALMAFSFDPIRTRLLHSQEHFYISGGRAEIWDIGVDLAMRYPLGIGFENGRLLSRFSPEIPKVLTHFHNNLINIIVELGWVSFFIYLWWIYVILRMAFSGKYAERASILSTAIGCGIVSWQVAGMVEYNLGDSEILLLVFVLLGALTSLKQHANS